MDGLEPIAGRKIQFDAAATAAAWSAPAVTRDTRPWRGHGDNSTVQYSTVQYSKVQYSTVKYSTVQYSTGTIQYRYTLR